jgi:hypothetical protein
LVTANGHDAAFWAGRTFGGLPGQRRCRQGLNGRTVPVEIYASVVLASECVEKEFAGRTRDRNQWRPAVGLEALITPPQHHADWRRSERASPEPSHYTPNVGICFRIEFSRLPAVVAPADILVMDEELVGIAYPIGSRSTQR